MQKVVARSTLTILVTAVAVVALARVSAGEAGAQRSSASVLSEHEIEVLDSMSPQSQAELLLERSINHFRGANDQIAARVDGWRGKSH